MMWTVLFILASGTAEPPAPPAEPRGARVAGANATARIIRPVVVRQSSGWQRDSADEPMPQISRRRDRVLIEFQ